MSLLLHLPLTEEITYTEKTSVDVYSVFRNNSYYTVNGSEITTDVTDYRTIDTLIADGVFPLKANTNYVFSFDLIEVPSGGTILEFTDNTQTSSTNTHFWSNTFTSTGHQSISIWTPSGISGASLKIMQQGSKISNLKLQEKHHTVYDCSGNNYDLTAVSTFNTQNSSARYTQCLSFNGTNNYLTRPSLPTDSIKTISVWVKGNKSSADVIFNNASNSTSLFFFYGALGISSGSGLPRFTLNNFINNSWNHIVVVYDSTPRVYVNGLAETAGELVDSVNHGNKLYIGCNNYLGDEVQFLNGQLSDFRIYTTCLSEEEVLDLYHTAASVDSNGNVYCYEFDESTLNSVGKNGIVTSNEFIEESAITSIYSNKIKTNQLIEI